jgi:preprotein translocase subunit SecG
MVIFLLILIVIASVFLILFILAQNPKGGGLSSTFGGTTQIVGARQSADFLEKATWYVAIGILVVILMTTVLIPSPDEGNNQASKIQNQIDEMSAPIQSNPNTTGEMQMPQGNPEE